VNILIADPNRPRLTIHATIANIDVVIAGGQIKTRVGSDCDIAIAGGVLRQSPLAEGAVFKTFGVQIQRVFTKRTVVVTSRVVEKRERSSGGIAGTPCIQQKGRSSNCCIKIRIIQREGSSANCGIVVSGH
jgi:hypothetical protein